MGGMMSVTGERDDLPGGGPQKAGLAFADLTTGLYAAIAIQAALLSRVTTGEGQHIDMALLDTQVASLSVLAMNYLTSAKVPGRLVMHMLISCLIKCLKPKRANLLLPAVMTSSLRLYVKALVCLNCAKTRNLKRIKVSLIAKKSVPFYNSIL
jgi:crotonobetainyl-CoA:carnitine CoA-transferase CaiB-like acyl-CoA transferase